MTLELDRWHSTLDMGGNYLNNAPDSELVIFNIQAAPDAEGVVTMFV